MNDKVKLKKMAADNWESMVDLKLGVGQEGLVATNPYLVAEVQFNPDARMRVVGFLIYDVQKTKGKA